jgi:hypothetical protein
LKEIKSILSRYVAEKVTAEMNRLWDEIGWTNQTMKEWAGEDFNTTTKL